MPHRTVHPAPLPFTSQFSPFPAYYLTYPYWHAILSRVYQAPAPICSPSRSPRFHTGHSPGRLQISYAMDSNGRLYPFSFQSLGDRSSPSRYNGAPRIPLIFLSLRTLSIATGGGTPPSPIFIEGPFPSLGSWSNIPAFPGIATPARSERFDPVKSLLSHCPRVTDQQSPIADHGPRCTPLPLLPAGSILKVIQP
jgi:hypothetical protein